MAKKRFPPKDVDELLVKCHRRCCICHRFCGVKIETDHIVPRDKDGPTTIDNAIAVCFECHAEIHSYNDDHPRGRKFKPQELRGHRDQWLAICDSNPEVMLRAIRSSDVGPLQSLIDELEFDSMVADFNGPDEQGCLFLRNQFLRAIQEGAIAILNEELKEAVLEAYQAMGRANQLIAGAAALPYKTEPQKQTQAAAMKAISAAKPKIITAKEVLLKFLGSEK